MHTRSTGPFRNDGRTAASIDWGDPCHETDRGCWKSFTAVLFDTQQFVIAFSLLQLAKTSFQLNQPGNEDPLAKAETAYQESKGCVELLPQEDRTSALFDLGKLRAALDEFRSAQAGSQDS